MDTRRPRSPLGAVTLAALALSWPAWGAWPAARVYQRYAVATDHAAASRAGAEVLAAGGNAVDAAIAAALALGVVSPGSSGFAGGGFATLCTPAGACTFLDFREVAPQALTASALASASNGARASSVGGLAVAVPGEPAGLALLSRRWGRLPLARAVAPAAALARRGFAVTPYLSRQVSLVSSELSLDPWLSAQWLPGGSPLAAGRRVSRPRLSATLSRYGREGERFVRGAFARAVAEAVRSRGGVMTEEDVARYQPVEREVLRGSFRGLEVVTAPYPSAGGLVLLETLAMLEGAPPERLRHGSSAYAHLLAEAWRYGFDDRARYVGDPANDGVVPARSLLDPARMTRRRSRIDPDRAGTVVADEPARDRGTTHLCVVDAQGMVVSLTTTVNDYFGARVASPSLDVVLNNEVDDYSLGAGSAWGLAASRPNALVPGRRPVSSMTPTIVLEGGRPVGCVGAAGGPRITTATAQVLLNLVAHGMDPEAAVSAPRVHHQGNPGALQVEREVPDDVRAALRARGHEVVEVEALAVAQAIWVRVMAGRRELAAASDPRKGGVPAGE